LETRDRVAQHFIPECIKSNKTAQRWRGWFHLILTGIYIIFGLPAGSQALDTVHALVDLAVRSNGQTVSVFLIPGEFEPDHWYYTTSNLHFGLRELSGKQVPEMTLLRYQRPDPDNPNKYLEGATLQLAVDVDPLDDSAKRSLRRAAETAARKWESEYYRDFFAKLKATAGAVSPKQEQWKALYEDYPKAREVYSNPRGTPTFDELIERALQNDLDSWAVEGLKESTRLLKMCSPVSVSPLPISTAQLTLYDGSGQAVQPVGPTRGAAPEYAVEKLYFTVELERNAADTSEALLTSRTGIFMILRREYEVLSSPLAYKIVIDYDRAWQQYRSNTSFVSQAVDFAAYQSADLAEKDKKNISTRLEKDIMKAFDADGNGVSLLSLDTKTLQALVGRINRAILQDEWAPSKVNLDTRGSPAIKDRVLRVPAVRDAGPAFKNKDKKPAVEVFELSSDAPARGGTETLLPGYRYRERKSMITQGFLSLADYSESIRNQLVYDEKTPVWENAYFLLPGIGDDPEFGIRKVTVNISLNIQGKKWREQTATWSSKLGWILEGGGQPTRWGIVSFPLPEARDKYGDKELLQAEFDIDQEIMSLLGRRYYLKAEYKVKIFDGKSMIASPLECIQPIIFDFSNLRWRSPELSVYSVEINVTQKLGRLPTLTLQRNVVPGRELLSLPLLLDPMLENDVGSVSAKIEFASKYYDAKAGAPVSITLPWNLSNENLVELYPALFVSIFNEDWKD
jgi:hypothetical protein